MFPVCLQWAISKNFRLRRASVIQGILSEIRIKSASELRVVTAANPHERSDEAEESKPRKIEITRSGFSLFWKIMKFLTAVTLWLLNRFQSSWYLRCLARAEKHENSIDNCVPQFLIDFRVPHVSCVSTVMMWSISKNSLLRSPSVIQSILSETSRIRLMRLTFQIPPW